MIRKIQPQNVGASSTIDGKTAATGGDDIISIPTVDGIVATTAIQDVIPVSTTNV